MTPRTRRSLGAALVTAALMLVAAPVLAQSDLGALKTEVERLRADIDNLRSEMRLMREILIQRLSQPAGPAPSAPPSAAAPPPAAIVARVKIGDAPSLGRQDAAVTMVEFSDYQCPFCRRFVETTLPTLKREYIDTGKLRYVFRDFPLDPIHPHARKAAEAAHCAGEQGRYWEMHDVLFQNQNTLEPENVRAYAGRLQLDERRFADCVAKGTHVGTVQRGQDEGLAAGIDATPGFILGRARADGVVEGTLVSGARPLNDFRQAIERLLAGNP